MLTLDEATDEATEKPVSIIEIKFSSETFNPSPPEASSTMLNDWRFHGHQQQNPLNKSMHIFFSEDQTRFLVLHASL